MSIAALDPARTALLVIDMQNAFVHNEGTLGVSGVDVAPAVHGEDVVDVVDVVVGTGAGVGHGIPWAKAPPTKPETDTGGVSGFRTVYGFG